MTTWLACLGAWDTLGQIVLSQHNLLDFIVLGLGLDSSFRSEKTCPCEYGSLLSSLHHLNNEKRKKNWDDFVWSKGVGNFHVTPLFYFERSDHTSSKQGRKISNDPIINSIHFAEQEKSKRKEIYSEKWEKRDETNQNKTAWLIKNLNG